TALAAGLDAVDAEEGPGVAAERAVRDALGESAALGGRVDDGQHLWRGVRRDRRLPGRGRLVRKRLDASGDRRQHQVARERGRLRWADQQQRALMAEVG